MKRELPVLRYLLSELESVSDPEVALALPHLIESYLTIVNDTPENRASIQHAYRILRDEKFIIADKSKWNTAEGPQSWDTLKGITWRGYNLIDAIDQNRPLDSV